MTEGPAVIASGCNSYLVTTAYVRIAVDIVEQDIEDRKSIEEMVQITANKKAEKIFKKMRGEPYQEILAFPETGKNLLLKSKSYKLSVSVGLSLSCMCSVVCALDTGADVGLM